MQHYKKTVRFLSLLLSVLMLFSMLPAFGAAKEETPTQKKTGSDTLYTTAAAALETMRASHNGETVEQTGITKADYAAAIAECLAKYDEKNDLFSLTTYKTLDDSLQAFARVVSAMAVLVAEGNVEKYGAYSERLFGSAEKFNELYIKFMTWAVNGLKSATTARKSFAVCELTLAYILTSELVPEADASHWLEKLGAIKPSFAKGDGGSYSHDVTSANNRAAYIDAAEQMREYMGLTDSDSYITQNITALTKQFSESGMFMDRSSDAITASPYLYDATVRAHLTLVDYYGYDGENSAALKDWLRKGGISSLFTLAANGEFPYNGRSNQFIFNDILTVSACEYEANYYKAKGDDYLAGVFKRSAHLALLSVRDYLTAGNHVKNMMKDKSFGTDKYGTYDKYMASLAAFLIPGYIYADDTIEEEYAPCEVGGYVACENEGFSSVFASCAGYSVQIQTAAANQEDSIGLGRIIKKGVHSVLGLSHSFTADASYCLPENYAGEAYSFDAAWKNASGKIVKLSDFTGTNSACELNVAVTTEKQTENEVIFSISYTPKTGKSMDGCNGVTETYTLNEDGVKISAELIEPVNNTVMVTVPLLDNNGDTEGAIAPVMTSDENSVTLTVEGEQYNSVYNVSSDGKFVFDNTVLYNRNGEYKTSHFEKEGSTITVNASLNKKKAGSFKLSATADKITAKFTGYYAEGVTAELYMLKANEYYYADENSGYVTADVHPGDENCVKIGEIALDGKAHEITIDRYAGTEDLIYRKFYLACGDTIYDGPMWVTDFDSIYTDTAEVSDGIKGIVMKGGETEEEQRPRLEMAADLNAETAKFDIIIGSFIKDEKTKKFSTEFVSGSGKTYYMQTKAFTKMDGILKRNTTQGIRTTLILQLHESSAPAGMIPVQLRTDAASENNIAISTETAEGVEAVIAFFEYLAYRYGSGENGLIDGIVLSNEIDFPCHWNKSFAVGPNGEIPTVEEYTEEYYRTLRLASIAVKKYNPDMRVLVPFTHYWADHGNELAVSYAPELYNTGAEISYAPKDIADILLRKSNEQGNFMWGFAPHPYAVSLVTADPIGYDFDYINKLITCDLDTPWLTYENIEVWDMYLQREEAKVNGQVRPIYLTESGVSCLGEDEVNQAQQAASISYLYYKISLLEPFVSWPYISVRDTAMGTRGGLNFAPDGTDDQSQWIKRYSYNAWKDIDTISTDEFDEKYGSYISYLRNFDESVSTYLDLLIGAGKLFGSSYDWKMLWYQKYKSDEIVAYGDVNADGKVDGADYVLLKNRLADPKANVSEFGADVDADNKITEKDLEKLLAMLAESKGDAVSTPSQEPNIIVSSETSPADKEFTVTVSLNSEVLPSYLQFRINYNTSLLTLKKAENGGLYKKSEFMGETGNVPLNVIFTAEESGTGKGELLKLTFAANQTDAAKEQTCDVTLEVTGAFDKDAMAMKMIVSSGTETITPSAHKLVAHEASAPTCTKAGWEAYYTCSECDYTTYKELPALGHNMTRTAAKEATADAEGNKEYYTCSVCKKVFTDAEGKNETTVAEQTIAKLGVDYKLGDIDNDGKITASDARLALRAAVGLTGDKDTKNQPIDFTNKTGRAFLAADADKDGKISAADARLILRACVSLEKL